MDPATVDPPRQLMVQWTLRQSTLREYYCNGTVDPATVDPPGILMVRIVLEVGLHSIETDQVTAKTLLSLAFSAILNWVYVQ